MKLKIPIVVFLSLVFLSSLFTPVAQAYQLKDTIALINVKRSDTKIYYHSSGKIIYAILQPSTPSLQSTINVYVYSSSMNEQGESSIVSGTNYYIWVDISIVELDSDEILIYAVEWRTQAGLHSFSKLIVYRYNIISYLFSSKYISADIWDLSSPATIKDGNLSKIYKYSVDNKFYVSGNTYGNISGSAYYKIFIGKFNPSDNTITVSSTTMTDDHAHSIFDYHNSTGIYNQYVYILTSAKSDDTAQFYTMDMSGFTLTFLTNYPTGGTFPDLNLRRINLLTAGIYESGDIKYLYFTWEYSYTSAFVRYIRLCQSRSVYNITISSATLLASGKSEMIIAPNLGSGSEPAWSIGISTTKENATVYFVNIIDSVYHISKYDSYIVDWLDYGIFDNWISDFTAIVDNELDITWGGVITNMIIYTPTGKIEILEVGGNTEIYLMTPLYIEYDITLIYTPPDNPLLTDTSYLFTFTTYANGLPTAIKYVAYFDSTQFGAGITESNGQKQFTNIVSLAGIHITTIKIYDVNNVLVRIETFDHLYKKVTIGTDITEEGVLMIGINSIFGIMPSLIIIGLPALLFYQIKNSVIMIVVGMTLGSVIGVLGGVIPLYILFIIILCDLLIMFYIRGDRNDIGE